MPLKSFKFFVFKYVAWSKSVREHQKSYNILESDTPLKSAWTKDIIFFSSEEADWPGNSFYNIYTEWQWANLTWDVFNNEKDKKCIFKLTMC